MDNLHTQDGFKETGIAVLRKWTDADFKRLMDIESDLTAKYLKIGALEANQPDTALAHVVAHRARRRALLYGVTPYETIVSKPNLLMRDTGARNFNLALTGGAFTTFNNANSKLGVGNGTAAVTNTQTDLQGASKLRKAMDGGYPSVFAAGANGNKVDWRSSFGNGEAEFAWEEWAIFNAAAAGDMLNRALQAFGTKAAGVTWQLTTTTSIA